MAKLLTTPIARRLIVAPKRLKFLQLEPNRVSRATHFHSSCLQRRQDSLNVLTADSVIINRKLHLSEFRPVPNQKVLS